jgi:hypothetical protein
VNAAANPPVPTYDKDTRSESNPTLPRFAVVSMEAGIRFARTATRSGHPPWIPTHGAVSPDQPLEYLLAKVAETVWEAVTTAHSELEPYLVPVRNYLLALAAKAGTSEARDFAVGVLTERVRQEENGWPDQEGEGKRGPHGSDRHTCLLARKHEVEDAIYYAVGL